MRGAAELATKYGAWIQTHLAENREEIEKVRHQFTWAADYTEVYEKCGLLGPRTVLGHCIRPSDREREATWPQPGPASPIARRRIFSSAAGFCRSKRCEPSA